MLDKLGEEFNSSEILLFFVSVIMSEDWGAADDAAPIVVAPEVQDIKLFGKWSTDDVQVSDISLTVSVLFPFAVCQWLISCLLCQWLEGLFIKENL